MERIEELTQKAQQRQRQGRTIEAIRLFEQALECRIDVHGPESSSVKKACENLSDILNGAALKHLQNEEYEEAKKLLQKAEMLTGPDDLISAVTFNNIACYYRRKNKLRTALKYLEKAQRIEMKSRVVSNPAGTRLNLCAVLSQLDRHNEALEHAQAAVVLLQEELVRMELDDEYLTGNPEALNKMAVLAISYHNIGVEEEYLKRHSASLAAYKRGVRIARQYLGPDNDITCTLIKSCDAAQEHLDSSRSKKPFSPQGIIRQGDSMGGAYDALQQHHTAKRRAQSAGKQRSQSATPSWAMEFDRSMARPSTAHLGAGSKSLSRTRAWVKDEKHGSLSLTSTGSLMERGPLKSEIRDRTRVTLDRNGKEDDSTVEGKRSERVNGHQRPASSLSGRDQRNDSSCTSHGGELEPMGGSMGAKRGPVTPRLDGEKIPAIRRPASASLREPVRPDLGKRAERKPLALQISRAEKVKEEKREGKSYEWEEVNQNDIDDEDDFFGEESFEQGPSNRRVAYERPAAHHDKNSSQQARFGGRSGGVVLGGNSHNANRGGRGIQLDPLDDDLLDDYEDGQADDVDSGTEDFIRERKLTINHTRAAGRPASASVVLGPREGARPSGRPASASIAAVKERCERERAVRPVSAAPNRAASEGGNVGGGLNRHRVGNIQNHPDRSMRPASAHIARPATAGIARPGSARPGTAHINTRPTSASVARPYSRDPRQDEMASGNRRDEREILDILSDHSEYESDLEQDAESLKKSTSNRDQQKDAKRVEPLAQSGLGVDHSDYESDDAGAGSTRTGARDNNQDREKHHALEQINARIRDHNFEDRRVVGSKHHEVGSGPNAHQRPQRPSDKARAGSCSGPTRPADSHGRRGRPESAAAPAMNDMVNLSDHSAYESNEDGENDVLRMDEMAGTLEDMAGTLKWLEDGLTHAP